MVYNGILERNKGAIMKKSCYITFPSTYHVLRAEAALREKSTPFKLVPVPRSISTACGTSLRCSCADLAAIKSILVQRGIEIDGSFEIMDEK